jgi:TfoX/Sxy family transcriptional regulator of competence genes
MAYDEAIADRIRELLIALPGVTEKKMFGGLAFMVQGNMAVGPVNDVLMVRVGPAAYEDALSREEASEMTFTGRPMRGMVQIGIEALDDDQLLQEWVERGVEFALSLPAKGR